jgi:hypothetical protein
LSKTVEKEAISFNRLNLKTSAYKKEVLVKLSKQKRQIEQTVLKISFTIAENSVARIWR